MLNSKSFARQGGMMAVEEYLLETLVVEGLLILCQYSWALEWILDGKFAIIQKLRDWR